MKKKSGKPEIKTGIWIDREKAYIISLSGDELPVVRKVHSDYEARVRFKGEGRVSARFGKSNKTGMVFIDDQERKQRRHRQELKHFYKQIKEQLGEGSSLYIFGPGSVKSELANDLKTDKNFKGEITTVENADSMSRGEMIHKVRKYFHPDGGVQTKRKSSKTK